jgi:hypothetical protein
MAILRHIVIGLLGLALTVGTGWQSCVTLQQQHPSSAAALVDHIASHQSHEHHQHAMAQDHEARVDDPEAIDDNVQQKSADHAWLKCCGACMQTSVMPLAPAWIVVLAASRLSFASRNEQLRGLIVFIDPDIPKPSV